MLALNQIARDTAAEAIPQEPMTLAAAVILTMAHTAVAAVPMDTWRR